MTFGERIQQLKTLFSYEKKAVLDDTNLEMLVFPFAEDPNELGIIQKSIPTPGFCKATDDSINENKNFNYVVFSPKGIGKSDKAILMLHGLNEGSWDKYLCWAERLCQNTGKPVILFPIAFHMNRAPREWRNPRSMMPWSNTRKERSGEASNTTFLNTALSMRMANQPFRFYASGLETANNVSQLVSEIKMGLHPLFKEGTSVNIFSYSIGAMLSQVLMMGNPGKLFTDSKLFMFCGGSLFSMMNGSARDILDKSAFDKLNDYYCNDFLDSTYWTASEDNVRTENAFKTLISPEVGREERELFFSEERSRVRAVSLKKDTVIPTLGVAAALGSASDEILEELDFPFEYSHQIPFPSTMVDDSDVCAAFDSVFSRACAFL